jgi:GNAT superfamily N-acetyltransferase
MTPELEIRPATRQDVSPILEMVKELAQYERLLHTVQATEADLREALFGPRPAAEAVVADCGGRAVGFALFFSNYSTFVGRPGIYIEDLYVRPAHRGQGIGRALMIHIIRLARDRRCGRVEWAALQWNEPAIRFYQTLGAKALDEWRLFRLTQEAMDRV